MKTRFVPDTGLTVRMTTVMFLLGGLFVALVVAIMFVVDSPALSVLVGLVGIGIAFFQWWRSDTVALRAMGARLVSPEEAPELHGIVDRLCAMADMPKPRVAVADTTVPNAFATGRSPERAALCVTTGIMRTLTPEELEAVIAHELSHVAHRDVLVMTVASSAGIVAGMVMRGAQWGGFGRKNVLFAIGALVASLVVYAVSFLLLRLLSRYRELCADRSGAYLTQRPSALASALVKISGEMNTVPQRDLRAAAPLNAFFIAPAVRGLGLGTLTSTHPPLQQRLDQLAKIATSLGQTL